MSPSKCSVTARLLFSLPTGVFCAAGESMEVLGTLGCSWDLSKKQTDELLQTGTTLDFLSALVRRSLSRRGKPEDQIDAVIDALSAPRQVSVRAKADDDAETREIMTHLPLLAFWEDEYPFRVKYPACVLVNVSLRVPGAERTRDGSRE